MSACWLSQMTRHPAMNLQFTRAGLSSGICQNRRGRPSGEAGKWHTVDSQRAGGRFHSQLEGVGRQHLSFHVWLLSLSITPSRSTPRYSRRPYSVPCARLNEIPPSGVHIVCMYARYVSRIFITGSTADEHLGGLYFLAVNMGTQISPHPQNS